eukprot:GHVH01010671.1.p1 GENE.GHVH01010671.1~~GHVH01010671.1.p1  ORF type:complete len:413 (+),score=85.14 GHVH01010671.1:649-1887(+)
MEAPAEPVANDVDELSEESQKRTINGAFDDDGYDYSQHFRQNFMANNFIQFDKIANRRRVNVTKVVERDGDIRIEHGVPASMFTNLVKDIAKDEHMATGNPEIRSKLAGMRNLGELDEDASEILTLLENNNNDQVLNTILATTSIADDSVDTCGGLDRLIESLREDRAATTRVVWGNSAPVDEFLSHGAIGKKSDRLQQLSTMKKSVENQDDSFSDDYSYEDDDIDRSIISANLLDQEYWNKASQFADDQIGCLGEPEVNGGVMDELLDIDEELLDYDSKQMSYYLTEKMRTDDCDKRKRRELPMVGGVEGDGGIVECGKTASMTKEEFRAKWIDRVGELLDRSSSELEDERIDIDNKPFVHDCQSILSTKSNLYHRPTQVSIVAPGQQATTYALPANATMLKPKKGKLQWH